MTNGMAWGKRVCGILLLILWFGESQARAQQAASPPRGTSTGTVLLASDVTCTVRLDGNPIATLDGSRPKKVQVPFGEHLLDAVTPDGQKWSKVITVTSAEQMVVRVEFGVAALATSNTSASPRGTLLVFADAPIDLEIDGKPAGSLSGSPEAPGQRVFTLTPGKHFLKAVSRELPEVNAAADVQIRDGAQEIVRAMVADQVAQQQSALRAREAARVEIETAKTHVKELDLRWVNVPAGKFRMGCSPSDKLCSDYEKPTHTVQITRLFQMMATDVTARQFRTWALANGYEPPQQPEWSAPDVPVVNVTWADAQAFCSTFGGRLPTEAEWEYAARGGSAESRYGSLDSIAWYGDNSGRDRLDTEANLKTENATTYVKQFMANENRPHPVATKQPNGFGLYDMLGNVFQWCGDWYDETYYKRKVEIDPTGPSSSNKGHAVRGSTSFSPPFDLTVSKRSMGRFYGFGGSVCVETAGRILLCPMSPHGADFAGMQVLGFRCVRDPASPVTVPFPPELKKLETPLGDATAQRTAPPLSKGAVPAALVAEDFAVVKRKLEEARRREEEAKQHADEAARKLAEQQRLHAEAEARAMAARIAAEDRTDQAEFAQQLGAALAGLGQSIADYQRVRRGDLTSLGIQPIPAFAPPTTSSTSSRGGTSSADYTTRTSTGSAQPTFTPAGARIVTGYAPPAVPGSSGTGTSAGTCNPIPPDWSSIQTPEVRQMAQPSNIDAATQRAGSVPAALQAARGWLVQAQSTLRDNEAQWAQTCQQIGTGPDACRVFYTPNATTMLDSSRNELVLARDQVAYISGVVSVLECRAR